MNDGLISNQQATCRQNKCSYDEEAVCVSGRISRERIGKEQILISPIKDQTREYLLR